MKVEELEANISISRNKTKQNKISKQTHGEDTYVLPEG